MKAPWVRSRTVYIYASLSVRIRLFLESIQESRQNWENKTEELSFFGVQGRPYVFTHLTTLLSVHHISKGIPN